MSQIDFRRPFYASQATPASAAGHWHPIDALRHQIERFYSDLSGGLWTQQFPPFLEGQKLPAPFRDFPPVDIVETDKGYEVATELSGVAEKDIDVSVVGGALKIKGERHEEHKDSYKGHFLRERSFGSFERSFLIPDDADGAKIEAVFKNGLLTVRMPKKAGMDKDVKKIAIRTA